jgi:membrane protease YdiL (CAAX protease family)
MLSKKPWRIEAVIQLVAGVFACLCLGVLLAGALHQAGIPAFASPKSFGYALVATLSFQGVAWLLIPVFLKHHGIRWREAFGLTNAKWKNALLLAAGMVVIVLPVVVGAQQLCAMLFEKLGWPLENQRAVELFANARFWWQRAYLALFALVIAPVAEEFIFRGVLYPFVKQLGWPRLAWIGVSMLFAAIHVNLPTFIPLFVLALAFTWLYETTDCLLAPVAAHCLFNAANMVILLIQS